MAEPQQPRIRILVGPQTGILGRIAYFALGLVILVAAFFFVGIALIAGAIIACVLLVRWWWLKRKLAQVPMPDDGVVEGEYRVIEASLPDHSRAEDPGTSQQDRSRD
ncbi:MAG: hypothetical protein KIT13_12780 [Burkholderiales bacterium]|nr:hypothetical protein [Burkholderiales bacterium]MCW5603224.1 hypothetical protein [Burkholderiales bacterium]